MAHQQEYAKKRTTGSLIRCNFCGHLWLSRSVLPLVSCASCRNHVKAKLNTITTTEELQNQKKNGGLAPTSSPPYTMQTQADNPQPHHQAKEVGKCYV